MKSLIKKGLLATCLVGVASSSMAASSIDLKVQGKIVPTSCTPSFASGGGIVDYGIIKMSTLSLVADTVLANKSVPVIVTCQEAARFGLTFTDQRKASVKQTSASMPNPNMKPVFGLGYGANQQKIGAYALSIDADSVKNKANQARWVVKNNGGTGWVPTQDKYIALDGLTTTVSSFTISNPSTPSAAVVPTAEEQIKFDLIVTPVISDLTNLRITDEVNLDGLTLISLVYL